MTWKAFWEISLFPNLAIKNRVVNEVILRENARKSRNRVRAFSLSLSFPLEKRKERRKAQRTAVEAEEEEAEAFLSALASLRDLLLLVEFRTRNTPVVHQACPPWTTSCQKRFLNLKIRDQPIFHSNYFIFLQNSVKKKMTSLGLPTMPKLPKATKFWKKRSANISEYDPTFRVVYLGNVLTGWAKGKFFVY